MTNYRFLHSADLTVRFLIINHFVELTFFDNGCEIGYKTYATYNTRASWEYVYRIARIYFKSGIYGVKKWG